MKKYILSFAIFLLSVYPSFSQDIKFSDIVSSVKQDSSLFFNMGLDETFCPMFDFDKANKCYQFLKRMRRWERTSSPYSANSRDYFSRDEEYDKLSGFGSPWEYEYEEGDTKWENFKDELLNAFETKHSSSYKEENEKQALVQRLEIFSKRATFKPLIFQTIEKEYKGSIEAYVDALYKKSLMTNSKILKKFIRTPSYKRFDADLGAQMTIAMKLYEVWLTNYASITPDKMGLYVHK